MTALQPFWTVRPKPQPDELLSSWMVRAAEMSGQKLHSWCTDRWPSVQLWTRDLDLSAPPRIIAEMTTGTAADPDLARRTSLQAFEGVLHPAVDRSALARFIRPLGVYHRTRRGFGLWFCPACLSEDAKPYYRRSWRLVGFACCTRHGLVLADRCPSCAAPVVPHRGGLVECHDCGTDLRTAECSLADASVLQLQHHCQRVLDGAPVQGAGLPDLHPMSFFALLNRLLMLMAAGPRRARLLDTLDGLLARPIVRHDEDARSELRFLPPAATHEAMRGVAFLLRGWPYMFVGVMAEAGIWWSWATRDASPNKLPFTYIEPVRRHLYTASAS